ncbi:hypothetical protein BVC80_741g8 [Macleaya cordata]|uniref:Uncharacterized protein n=1 Tax=Macleaya cordata TaxID=56857 RepID=A0A200QN54_MACCD|nr:hypothetical protein BVC80_741g8 [Macleaya cordata]
MAGRTEGKRSRRSEPPAHTDARLETDERVEEWLDASFSPPIASPETLDSHHNEEPRPIKNKRGKTVVRGLGMDRHESKEVAFNERGQPIGDTSVTLSSFIGALVRASVPLYEESWRKVSKQHKDNLWTIVLVILR